MRYLLVLLLAGCAAAPISETAIPPEALARCVSLSEEHSIASRAATRGAVEAARAYGVGRALDAVAGATSVPLGWIFAGYFVTSAINGAIEAQDRRDAIVRECLRDAGHKVY